MSAKECITEYMKKLNERFNKGNIESDKLMHNSQEIDELLSSPALQNLQKTSSYIDPIDLQILTRSHQINKIYYK